MRSWLEVTATAEGCNSKVCKMYDMYVQYIYSQQAYIYSTPGRAVPRHDTKSPCRVLYSTVLYYRCCYEPEPEPEAALMTKPEEDGKTWGGRGCADITVTVTVTADLMKDYLHTYIGA